jgi:hypothetical protein
MRESKSTIGTTLAGFAVTLSRRSAAKLADFFRLDSGSNTPRAPVSLPVLHFIEGA